MNKITFDLFIRASILLMLVESCHFTNRLYKKNRDHPGHYENKAKNMM